MCDADDKPGPLWRVEFPPELEWKIDQLRNIIHDQGRSKYAKQYASAILDDVSRLTSDLVGLQREAQQTFEELI
jgi:hypothetical protein